MFKENIINLLFIILLTTLLSYIFNGTMLLSFSEWSLKLLQKMISSPRVSRVYCTVLYTEFKCLRRTSLTYLLLY